MIILIIVTAWLAGQTAAPPAPGPGVAAPATVPVPAAPLATPVPPAGVAQLVVAPAPTPPRVQPIAGLSPDIQSALLAAHDPDLVTHVADLPANISDLMRFLTTAKPSTPLEQTMADAGKPFTQRDVLVLNLLSKPAPFARLVWATRVGPYYVLHWQRGGFVRGDYVHIYGYGPDGRPQLIWLGGKQADKGDPHGVLADYAAFRATLTAGGIKTVAAGAACIHPLHNISLPTALLVGPAAPSTITQKPGDLPPAVAAQLGASSRLDWAEKLGPLWFVQVEQGSAARLMAIQEGEKGARQVFSDGHGPYDSLEAFRDLVRRNSPKDLRDAAAAGACPAN